MPRAASILALNTLPAGPRLLALFVPGLPLQRLARSRETSGGRPVAVAEEGRVLCCDAAAGAAGVRPGDTLAEALAACGRLLAVPHAPAADLAALRALAEALLAVAPSVEVASPDALLLDASAAHLLGGGRSRSGGWPIAPGRWPASSASRSGRRWPAGGAGAGAGPARSRAGRGGAAAVPPGAEALALAPLPLAALGLGPAVVGEAAGGRGGRRRRRWPGCRSRGWRSASARPARRRPGWPAGTTPTPLVPYLPETLPEEAIELEGPADGAEPVLFVLKRLADRVAARLAGRGLGASRLTVTLKLDPRGEERLTIPLAQPSAVGGALAAGLARSAAGAAAARGGGRR